MRLPTKANISKSKAENNKDFINSVRLGNRLIENFIENKNIYALKMMIYLAKIDTELHNIIEKEELGNEIVNFEVQLDELCEYIGIKERWFKKEYKDIQKTQFIYENKEEDEYIAQSIFPSISIKQNIVKIKMFKDLFKELKRNLDWIKEKRYTPIKFINRLMKLRNTHSFRMYLLLSRLRDYKSPSLPQKIFTLEEFNGYFDINYSELKYIKLYILDVVEEELKNLIPFSYEPVYAEKSGKGRKPLIGYKIIYKSPSIEVIDDDNYPVPEDELIDYKINNQDGIPTYDYE